MPKHVVPPSFHTNTFTYREEQIIGTRDKPQCLVIQRLLSHLQYPVCTKSSTRDLSHSAVNLGVVDRSRFVDNEPTDEIRQGLFLLM